jgi:D-glycerate 3-kinase
VQTEQELERLVANFINENLLHKDFSVTAKSHFVPLAEQIKMHHSSARKTYYVGINGCQGSGKSTLAAFLNTYLHNLYHLNVEVLSLDDFYLSQSERLSLSVKVHPLFKTRGVPGTHNMQLAKEVLNALGEEDAQIAIPKFSKATDNPYPKNTWPLHKGSADIVILEGWCWGVKAQDEIALKTPVNTLEQQEDSLGVWRTYANRQLKQHYQPLYDVMDYWVMLKAPSFKNVLSWRHEQEQKLAKSVQGQQAFGIMNEEQINNFIQYYQRLTEHGLATLPTDCNRVFELDSNRSIIGVHKS